MQRIGKDTFFNRLQDAGRVVIIRIVDVSGVPVESLYTARSSCKRLFTEDYGPGSGNYETLRVFRLPPEEGETYRVELFFDDRTAFDVIILDGEPGQPRHQNEEGRETTTETTVTAGTIEYLADRIGAALAEYRYAESQEAVLHERLAAVGLHDAEEVERGVHKHLLASGTYPEPAETADLLRECLRVLAALYPGVARLLEDRYPDLLIEKEA